MDTFAQRFAAAEAMVTDSGPAMCCSRSVALPASHDVCTSGCACQNTRAVRGRSDLNRSTTTKALPRRCTRLRVCSGGSCAEMVASDLKTAKRHALLKEHGYELPVAIEG